MNNGKEVLGSFDSLALGNTEESWENLKEKEESLTNKGHEIIHTDDALHFYVNGMRVYDVGRSNMMWDSSFAPIYEIAKMCKLNWCDPMMLAQALSDSIQKWSFEEKCRKSKLENEEELHEESTL